MSEFMTTYQYFVIFAAFILGIAIGRIIERGNSMHEDCSRAEDDAGY